MSLVGDIDLTVNIWLGKIYIFIRLNIEVRLFVGNFVLITTHSLLSFLQYYRWRQLMQVVGTSNGD